MRNHVKSVVIGLVLAVVGLLLWRTMGEVDTPVISLDKVGVVLLVLGAIEVVVSGAALAMPTTRHRDEPL